MSEQTILARQVSNFSAASDARISALRNMANGICGLDSGGKVPVSQLPAAVLGGVQYQGTWNASTNSPTIVSSTGTNGHYYRVSVDGTTSIDGVNDWAAGDWIIFNGTVWQKVDNTDKVSSVNGYTGAVSLTKSDLSLGNVENTTLSTWSGTTNVTTLGTVSTGIWSATAIAVAKGGTGATDAFTARTNLGLAIGSDVQAYSSVLGTYAGITPSTNVQSLLSCSNYAAIRTALSLGTAALSATGDFAAASHSHASADITSGTIETARLGTGTANSSSYLRGDQTWAILGTMATQSGTFSGTSSGTNTGDQDLSGYQTISGKDATGGYVGLTLFKINFKNTANTLTSFFTNAATIARTYTFKDADGTMAFISDITGTNSGINTGDNATNSQYSVLVSNATHTGDVTGSTALTLATAQPAVHTWALAQTFTAAPVFTDASGTRTALGLVIGTNVQAYDAELGLLASLSLTGNSLKVIRVNSAETAFELATVSSGGLGDVVGPASATADRLAVFDSTTGKLIKDGGKTVAELLSLTGGTMTGALTLDAASLLKFGGSTSAYPALKRSGAELQVRLADDIGYASMSAASYSFSNANSNGNDARLTWNGSYIATGTQFYAGAGLITDSRLIIGAGQFSGYSYLYSDAADTFAQRNGTNAQTFRVYGTYTNTNTYVRASLSASATAVTLAAQTAGGTGNCDLILSPKGTGKVLVRNTMFVGVDDNVTASNRFAFFGYGNDTFFDVGINSDDVRWRIDTWSGLFKMHTSCVLGWCPAGAAASSIDVSFGRNGAGVVEINNGTAGTYRDLILRNINIGGQIASRVLTLDGSKNVTTSAVTTTELGYLSGVTSAIQTQLATYLPLAGGTMTGLLGLQGYTVSTLPAGTQGDTAYVTDALLPSFLAPVTGGGGVVTTVFNDGTNWIVQ